MLINTDSNTYYAIYESIYYNSIQKQHIELKHKEYLNNLVILNSCHNHGYNVDKENNRFVYYSHSEFYLLLLLMLLFTVI